MTSRAFLLASTAIAVALAASPANAQSAPPRLEVGLSGSPEALGGEIGLFAPVELGDGLIAYGSVYAGILPGIEELYASAGAGLRTRLDDGWVGGANFHFDALGSSGGNAYQQISAGLELLSRHFEFRLEGNLPIGTTANEDDSRTSVGIENDALTVRQGYEVALYGLKAEAGIRLPVFEDDSGHALKLYAEAFTRGGPHVAPIYGLGGRIELQFASFEQWPGAGITVGAGLSHDTTGQTAARAFIRFSAPLGGAGTPAAQPADPLYAPVGHNPRIATRAGALGAAQGVDYLDGRPTGTVRHIDDTTGDAAAINALIAAAGENAVLLANGTIEVDDSIRLAMGQTLFGGGTALTVVAQGTGKRYTIANPGARAHLVAGTVLLAAPDKAVLELANRTTVTSLDITGGAFGISGEGVSGIGVADVKIADTTSHGLRFVDVDGATIRDVTYTSASGCSGCPSMAYSNVYDTVTQAALYGVGLRNASIENFEVDGAGWGLVFAGRHDGTAITSATSDITVRNVTIRNTSQESLLFYLAENIDVSGFEIDNRGRAEADVHDSVVFMSSRDISLSDGVAQGGINGLMFVDPEPLPLVNGNIRIADVAVTDTYRAGIFLNPTDGVSFDNVEIVRPAANSWATAIFMFGGWSPSDAITNIAFNGVSVRDVVDPGSSGINLVGHMSGITGDIAITGAGTICNDWGATITGTTLLINGSTLASAC